MIWDDKLEGGQSAKEIQTPGMHQVDQDVGIGDNDPCRVRGRHGLRLRQQHIPFLFAIVESHIAKQACEWLRPETYHLRQLLQLRPSDRMLPDGL
jgi:hypothetical protein